MLSRADTTKNRPHQKKSLPSSRKYHRSCRDVPQATGGYTGRPLKEPSLGGKPILSDNEPSVSTSTGRRRLLSRKESRDTSTFFFFCSPSFICPPSSSNYRRPCFSSLPPSLLSNSRNSDPGFYVVVGACIPPPSQPRFVPSVSIARRLQPLFFFFFFFPGWIASKGMKTRTYRVPKGKVIQVYPHELEPNMSVDGLLDYL